jgi:uncharacterized membrane protein
MIPGDWQEVSIAALLLFLVVGSVIAFRRKPWPREQHRSYFSQARRFPQE